MSDEPLTPEQIEALLAAHGGEDGAEAVADDAEVIESEAVAPLDDDGLAPGAELAEPLVEAVELEPLIDLETDAENAADIKALYEVPLEVAVELGRAVVSLRELLEVGQGSILQLDRHAGEPVDVLVNGRCLARGEVVVIDEDFGIRITQVVSAEERLRSMGKS